MNEDRPFSTVWMAPPHNEKENHKTIKSDNNQRGRIDHGWMKIFNSIRENDLLLLSKEKLTSEGKGSASKHSLNQNFNFSNADYSKICNFFNPDKGRILCLVSKRMKKNDAKLELKITYENDKKVHSL